MTFCGACGGLGTKTYLLGSHMCSNSTPQRDYPSWQAWIPSPSLEFDGAKTEGWTLGPDLSSPATAAYCPYLRDPVYSLGEGGLTLEG